MNRELIEKEFRATEDYMKISRRLKPAGMEILLNDLQELEDSIQNSGKDITPIVLNVIRDERRKQYSKMKPLVVFKEVLLIIDPQRLSGYWAELP